MITLNPVIVNIDLSLEAPVFDVKVEFNTPVYEFKFDFFPIKEPGKDFTFEDFTPDQLLFLKKPALDAAEIANSKATLANQAAIDANAAKELALEVANHPDVVINEYWHKWNTVIHAYENTGIKAKGEQGPQGLTGIYASEIVTSPLSGTLLLKMNTEIFLVGALTSSNNFNISVPNLLENQVSECILCFKIGASLPTIVHPSPNLYWRGSAPVLAINTSWTFCYERVRTSSTTSEIWAIAIKNA